MLMVEMERTSFKPQLTMTFQELVLIGTKQEKDQAAQHQTGLHSTGELLSEMEELLMELKRKEMEDQHKLL